MRSPNLTPDDIDALLPHQLDEEVKSILDMTVLNEPGCLVNPRWIVDGKIVHLGPFNPATNLNSAWVILGIVRNSSGLVTHKFYTNLMRLVNESGAGKLSWPLAMSYVTPEIICRALLMAYES